MAQIEYTTTFWGCLLGVNGLPLLVGQVSRETKNKGEEEWLLKRKQAVQNGRVMVDLLQRLRLVPYEASVKYPLDAKQRKNRNNICPIPVDP